MHDTIQVLLVLPYLPHWLCQALTFALSATSSVQFPLKIQWYHVVQHSQMFIVHIRSVTSVALHECTFCSAHYCCAMQAGHLSFPA